MNVVILHDRIPPDARPDETDALVQVQAVSRALIELGHTATAMPFSLDLAHASAQLRSYAPDLVFNLVESVEGRGQLIYLAPALLDSLGIRYTGCTTEAVFCTSSKLLTKRTLCAYDLPTPGWVDRDARSFGPGVDRGRCDGCSRFIIKSVWEDASLGLDDQAIVETDETEALTQAMRSRATRLGGEAFAEAYVEGREFNLSLLAAPPDAHRPVDVLSPAEIRFIDFPAGKPRIVGYAAKWDENSIEYRNTRRAFDFAEQDRELIAALERIALRCWDLFDLTGYARVDFRVADDGTPWILEINANPCLAPDAGFAAAAHRAGLTYSQIIQRILTAGLRNRSLSGG